MTTGATIRLIRISEGISQAELAQDLNVNTREICRIETGRREASLRILRKIAHRFRVPLALLLLGEEADSPNDEVFCLLKKILDRLLTHWTKDMQDDVAGTAAAQAVRAG